MKVLLSCYACEPNRGSEPGVGWYWAQQMSKHCETWVLTRSNNRPAIEAAIGTNPENLHFLYTDLPDWIIRLKKRHMLSTSLYYFLWQAKARRFFDASGIQVDVIHHITFNSFIIPGMWYRRKEKVVLGPLGGMSATAPQYLRCFPTFARFKEWIHTFRTKYLWRLNPFYLQSRKHADFLLFTEEKNGKIYAGERPYKELIDVITPAPLLHRAFIKSPRSGFVWAGILEPRKAPQIAIEAYAKAFTDVPPEKRPPFKFFGDGSLRSCCEKLIRKYQLEKTVFLCGKVQQEQLWNEIQSSNALVFSSIRDTCGNITLESLVLGTPLICFHHQGVGAITTDDCAIRIEPTSYEDSVAGFADAMKKLASDPALIQRMGENGRNHILQIEKPRVNTVLSIYHSLGLK